ncbi:MAG: biopolymer transporter ExbD [Bacteroidota bacterium]
MPKVKIPRKSTSIDMTAMCDVSFLLLTFFMLTSKFRPPEAVPIDLPNARSQTKLDKIMTISVAKDGAIYFSLLETSQREQLLENMLRVHPEIKLDVNQKRAFKGLDMFGFSLAEMPGVLSLNPEEYKAYKQKGIPADSAKCELAEWILQARYVDPYLKIAVKGDKNSNIKSIKQVIYALTQKSQVYKFNLITTLSGSSKEKNVTTEEPKTP